MSQKNETISNLRIIRITPDDVARRSDTFNTFRNTVIENEVSYPLIGKWLDQKVASGIRSTERTAYIGLIDEQPVATAVVKKGHDSKFCHLKLSDNLRDQNVGELFFALMALEVRSFAQDVHFTLPESLWAEKAEFFRGFGFEEPTFASRQYRLIDSELRTTTSFAQLWRSALGKLPKLARLTVAGHSLASGLLLSIAPRYATQIMNGEKSVEIRRRFSAKWIGSRVVIYSTAPTRTILGEATIRDVITEDPDLAWCAFKGSLGCSHHEYLDYVRGCKKVFALMLGDVTPYREPIPISQLEHLIDASLQAPQSYCTTEDNDWSLATAVAALLHGSLRTTTRSADTVSTVPDSHSRMQGVLFP
jgi:predicted transcriptional regulator